MIYLDNSATTRVCDAASKAALLGMQEQYHNPSSSYAPSVHIDKQIRSVRERLAAAMGASADEIVFTSGGTESDNIAILGTSAALRPGQWRFVSSAMEHAAVYDTMRALERAGQEVVWLPCSPTGQIDPRDVAAAVNDRTALVSVMHVNNEFGSLCDLAAIRSAIKRANPYTLLHSDGVQAFGKLPFAPIPADLYAISGHKFYAPKGVGALMLRKGVKNGGGFTGGGQERGVRSGTLNTPGIYGMGAALAHLAGFNERHIAHMRACKHRLASHLLQLSDVEVNGPQPEDGVGHILNLSFHGVKGEVMLHALAERGVLVSTGSACSSKKKAPNRVLAAIGVTGERADSAVRFSFSPANTLDEMDAAAEIIVTLVKRLRQYRPR